MYVVEIVLRAAVALSDNMTDNKKYLRGAQCCNISLEVRASLRNPAVSSVPLGGTCRNAGLGWKNHRQANPNTSEHMMNANVCDTRA
mmetsp:Transcript_5959/g.10003  ORF Transcript_5959/g.10003 Transcript_5959/m.10003 type:complete len:87 (-) Transcript_5959:765-1025(-)